jgi:hypothetical protein
VSTLTLRWANTRNVMVLVNGQPVGSATDDDEFPGEPSIPLTRTVAEVAEMVARALGADIEEENP